MRWGIGALPVISTQKAGENPEFQASVHDQIRSGNLNLLKNKINFEDEDVI